MPVGEKFCWQHKPGLDKRHRGGPVLKLTQEVIGEICECVELGMTLADAAASAGVSTSSVHKWRKMGAEGTSDICVEFVAALKKAKAKGVKYLFGRIRKIADDEGKWQGHAWTLERSHGYRGLANGEVQPGSMLAGLQSGDEEVERRTLITAFTTMAMEARAKGDYATARGLMADVARLLALNPTDKAALERAGIGDSTLEVRESMESRTTSMVQQAEEFVKRQAEGEGDE